jgi:Restriction endonuclease EcoRV
MSPSSKSGSVPANPHLVDWLREAISSYTPDAAAVYRRDGIHSWPMHAVDAADLERQLWEGGHFLPLPREPAALANVLEVSLIRFLSDQVSHVPEITLRQGTERGYPDLEVTGPRFGGGFHAIDIKAARRKQLKRSAPTTTQSRITLYTGNTYFKWPQLQWPGMFRPFDEYESHIDVIVIYTFDEDALARATDIEVLVQEPWRIASRDRSSTTREYIGAVTSLQRLRKGEGEFATEEEFYAYWRAFKFRMPEALNRQVQALIVAAAQERNPQHRRPPA